VSEGSFDDAILSEIAVGVRSRALIRGDGIRALGVAREPRSFDLTGVACSCRS